jgi:NAD(P)H-flavin reductase
MQIIINNVLYDITNFIKDHPGGQYVFNGKNNKDITNEFNRVGHSHAAKKLLNNYKIRELTKGDELYNKNNNEIIIKNNMISKLFTHEDKYNLHKILGLLCLINYIYLFYDFIYTGLISDFTFNKIDYFFIFRSWLHALLSLSSLQFHIPLERNNVSPMIWKEFRFHSILFAMRHIVILNMIFFFGKNMLTNILRYIIICLTMISADLITYNYADEKKTTTASMPYWNGISPKFQQCIKFFYTYSQILATLACLIPINNINNLLFLVLPIQLAALLMTLVRKNIITTFHYHLIYGLSLLTGYIISLNVKNIYLLYGIALIFYYFRINLKFNKYYLWLTMFFIVNKFNSYTSLIIFIGLTLIFYFTESLFDKFAKNQNITNNIVLSNKKYNVNHHMIKIKSYKNINNNYYPGKHYYLYFNNEKRPYTPINVDINTDVLTFFIKSYQKNTISNKICNNYFINSTINIDGPYGKLYYDKKLDVIFNDKKGIQCLNIIMFSCGTGITPFYSIIKGLNKDTKYKIILNCSFSDDNNILLIDEIKSLHNDNIKINLFISEDNNKLTEDKVKNILSKYNDYFILICGTNSFNDMIKRNCVTYNFFVF